MNYILIISGKYKLTIIDINSKGTYIDAVLNISEFSKIDSVLFLDLNRILICLVSDENKTYCIYEKGLNLLLQLDYNQEVKNIITNGQDEIKNIKSVYNQILKDYIFHTRFFNLIPEENDQKKFENKNQNDELICLQEKILFNHDLNQKNEFIMFFKKFIIQLIKNGFYYQLFDYLFYIREANKKILLDLLVNLN
jgi:hypothetical protein